MRATSVFALLLIVGVSYAAHGVFSDPKWTKPARTIPEANDDLVLAINTMYNSLAHTNKDAGNAQKRNFSLLGRFYLSLFENMLQVGPTYDDNYKRAMKEAFEFDMRNPPHVVAAAPRRALDMLRAVIGERVAAVQRICEPNYNEAACFQLLLADDIRNNVRCTGYNNQVNIHKKALDVIKKVKKTIQRHLEASTLPNNSLLVYLQQTKNEMKNDLVTMAMFYRDLLLGKYPCATRLYTDPPPSVRGRLLALPFVRGDQNRPM